MTTEIRSTDEQRIMDLVARPGTHSIAGIVECRAVLSLAAKGEVRIVSGNITRDGGSGTIVAANAS